MATYTLFCELLPEVTEPARGENSSSMPVVSSWFSVR